MFVIRDKKSKAVLHIQKRAPGEHRKPEEIFPGFDPKTMEFGRSEDNAIPAAFTIEDGIVKPEEPPAPEAKEEKAARAAKDAPAQGLDELKEATLEQLSRLSFELRAKLLPDYKLQNAALGVYDEEKTQAIRDTTKAFRDEYLRLEALVKKAKSAKELQGLKANFPTRVEAASGGQPRRPGSSKEKK
jgi:hypothetical protein